MIDIFLMLFPLIKAAHLIFAFFWIAGLFMLPRFFIYQYEAEPGSDEDTRWIERSRRLIRIILNPSMIILWVMGLTLAFLGGAFSAGWFHAKLLILILLSGYHGWAVALSKKLAGGQRPFSEKKLRILNEVPGLATVFIVLLAVLRPF